MLLQKHKKTKASNKKSKIKYIGRDAADFQIIIIK
jgi:hypothetical protein